MRTFCVGIARREERLCMTKKLIDAELERKFSCTKRKSDEKTKQLHLDQKEVERKRERERVVKRILE